uniref:Uncharacterized protein n=1 Tax=Heliothis virescens TaxID=7102 RepID=A0A2A4K008_HELVI
MSANSPPGKSDGDDPVDRPVPDVPPNPIDSLGARLRDLDVDSIRRYLAQKLGFYEPPETAAPTDQVLEEVSLDGIVKWIQSERCKNIITLAGAGISTCKYPKLSKLNMTLSELENFLQHMGRLIDFAYDETEPLLKLMDVFDMKEFSQQTVQLMKELAPNCDEMLMQCLWAGKVVDCKTIFKVRKTIRGHCCAFNYVLDYESADK